MITCTTEWSPPALSASGRGAPLSAVFQKRWADTSCTHALLAFGFLFPVTSTVTVYFLLALGETTARVTACQFTDGL